MNDLADAARSEGVRLEFLALVATDRIDGRSRGLAEYLELFPGHERAIAEAWLGLDAEDTRVEAERGADERIVGPYRLIDELGRGGQGVVWVAQDTRIDRVVALKTVPRSPLFGELAPRLEREARALARLEHPGICQVHDLGVDDGVAWIAMRLEPGRTLAQRIADGDCADRDAREIVGWIERAARAVHAAHVAGFLHRDVKPGNLMVRDDGHVVVLDFGVATDDQLPVPLTLTGAAVGTPGYMSPEQLTVSAGAVDRRSDVWALGVTLYEALTGERPFAAATRDAESRRALDDDVASVAPIHARGVRGRDLDTLLSTALAKDAEHRYVSAEALADDLARLARGEPLGARRPSAPQRFVRWARRRPGLAASLAALVAVAVMALALFARSERQLRNFRRLADLESARDLVAARDALFPIAPERVALMRTWVERADELIARAPLHRATLSALPRAVPDAWSEADETGERWMRAQLEDLLVLIEDLESLRAFVAPQARLADELHELATEAHAAAWSAAAERVASDTRFDGLELVPQLGLQPLGPDPASGLEEFAHLPTGRAATRNEATGALVIDESTGVVLVLVPHGATTVGCSRPDEGLAHPDPRCGPWDGPPQSLTLEPFLVSKYELTQAQWSGQHLSNPSYLTSASRWISGSSGLHPVENASFARSFEVVRAMGLGVPTESQWEHCARAGSASPWSFGGEEAELGAWGNIADATVAEHNDELGWILSLDVDDGHVGHAPVGTFAPNAWGLHDVHGNVSEMTRSTFEDWREHAPRDGTGETERKYELVVHRGGAYNGPSIYSRSSFRAGAPDSVQAAGVGIRPIRRLDR